MFLRAAPLTENVIKKYLNYLFVYFYLTLLSQVTFFVDEKQPIKFEFKCENELAVLSYYLAPARNDDKDIIIQKKNR